MGAKATFNATTRIITLTEAPVLVDGEYVVDIDVKTDLYSDGKEDWLADSALRRVRFPIQAIGGQTVPSGALDATFFLASDWKIQPGQFSLDYRLRVDGNLYSPDGKSTYLPLGEPGYSVFVEQTLSAIVRAAFVDETAVVAAVGGEVWSTDLSPYSGTTAGAALGKVLRIVKALLGL